MPMSLAAWVFAGGLSCVCGRFPQVGVGGNFGDCGWPGMGWSGGLILSKAQKSAATPTHPLLAYGFCSPTEELGFRVPFRCRKRAKCGHWPLTALEQLTLLLPAYRIYPPDMMQFTP